SSGERRMDQGLGADDGWGHRGLQRQQRIAGAHALLRPGLELLHHLVKVEARPLLADRELLEALEPLRHHPLRGHDDESARGEIAPVIRSRIGTPLEGCGPEIDAVGNAEASEALPPYVETRMVLLDETDLPLVDAHREQVTVVAPVEELVPRRFFHLAPEEGYEVVAVEVDLEALAPGLTALLAALDDIG